MKINCPLCEHKNELNMAMYLEEQVHRYYCNNDRLTHEFFIDIKDEYIVWYDYYDFGIQIQIKNNCINIYKIDMSESNIIWEYSEEYIPIHYSETDKYFNYIKTLIDRIDNNQCLN